MAEIRDSFSLRSGNHARSPSGQLMSDDSRLCGSPSATKVTLSHSTSAPAGWSYGDSAFRPEDRPGSCRYGIWRAHSRHQVVAMTCYKGRINPKRGSTFRLAASAMGLPGACRDSRARSPALGRAHSVMDRILTEEAIEDALLDIRGSCGPLSRFQAQPRQGGTFHRRDGFYGAGTGRPDSVGKG